MENEEVVASLIIIATLILCISGMVLLLGWYPAEREARIYNAKFGTAYSTSDFFFAGGTIKEMHEEKVPERPKIYKADLKMD